MIYSVRGTLIHSEPGLAVIECAGVGYKCTVTYSTLSRLPKIGEEVRLYTHLNVREDAVDLFGFYDLEELRCFKMLTSVSGVGPKAALSILSDLTPERFALCVAGGDYKTLTRSNGIGAKTAQRIVLELKDKVEKAEIVKGVAAGRAQPVLSETSSEAAEAISALVVLGYSQSEAVGAVAALAPGMKVEEMIKAALKQLASRR